MFLKNQNITDSIIVTKMHAPRVGFTDVDDLFVAVAAELRYPPSPHRGHSNLFLADVYKTYHILTFCWRNLWWTPDGSRWAPDGSRWLQMGSRWLQVGSRWLSGKSSSRDTHYINKLPINRRAAGTCVNINRIINLIESNIIYYNIM